MLLVIGMFYNTLFEVNSLKAVVIGMHALSNCICGLMDSALLVPIVVLSFDVVARNIVLCHLL